MIKLGRVVVVFAAVFVAACIPETEKFLSKPGDQPNDARIAGTWYSHNRSGSEVIVLTVRASKDKKSLGFVWTEIKPGRTRRQGQRPVKYLRFSGHTTKLGNAGFLNLRLVDGTGWKSGAPKRFIMRYWIDKRGLRVAFMKNDIVKQAIKEGRLAGKIVKNDVKITASAKALAAFIRRAGPDVVFSSSSPPLRRIAVTPR